MATSVKELRAELAQTENALTMACVALSRSPDGVIRSGRIQGTDSRYQVRIWYRRNSGSHLIAFDHVRNGEPTTTTFYANGPAVARVESGRACSNPENTAVRDLWIQADSAMRACDRDSAIWSAVA